MTHVLIHFLGRLQAVTAVSIIALIGLCAHVQAQIAILFVDGDDGLASPTGSPPGESWSDAYLYLTDAITRADELLGQIEPPPPDQVQIWVKAAGGPYLPDHCATCDGGNPGGSGDRAASFTMLDQCAWYGGFVGGETTLQQRNPEANVTVFSGDLDGDDEFSVSRALG